MSVRLLTIEQLPSGTKLREPIQIRIEHEGSGLFFASAPELGLWLDGVGSTEECALEDLERVIKRQKEAFSDVSYATASDYLRKMMSTLARIDV